MPVRPARCTRTSTPSAASDATNCSPSASSPTRPMNRTAQPMRAAAAATLAALPPRRRSIRAAVSVPRAGGPVAWITTSSSRSPTTPSTERSYHGPRYRLLFRQRESPWGNRGLYGLRGSASAGRRSPFMSRPQPRLRTGVGCRNPPMRRKPRMGSCRGSMVGWRHPTRRRRPPRWPWPSTCSSRPSAARRGESGGGPTGSARLLADDAGREFLFALTDQVLRTPDAGAGDASSSAISSTSDCPTRSPASTGPGCASPALGSTVAPGPVAAVARRRIRAETRGVIVPADDPAFRRHVARRHERGLRRQRQPARRGDRRRRRGRRPPRRAVRADAAAGRRLRLGEDLGAVRQPRRARLRSRGRAHRRTPAHDLRRRRRAARRRCSSTSTWRSTATSSSRWRRSAGCSTSRATPSSPPGSCCRRTSPTPTTCSSDSSAGSPAGAGAAAPRSRSGW